MVFGVVSKDRSKTKRLPTSLRVLETEVSLSNLKAAVEQLLQQFSIVNSNEEVDIEFVSLTGPLPIKVIFKRKEKQRAYGKKAAKLPEGV